MSDPRSTEPYRRVNRQGAVARAATTNTAGSTWVTLWTWLLAITAAVVVLSLVFALTRSDLLQSQSSEPAATGSASGEPASPSSVPAQPSVPGPDDHASAPAPATSADGP